MNEFGEVIVACEIITTSDGRHQGVLAIYRKIAPADHPCPYGAIVYYETLAIRDTRDYPDLETLRYGPHSLMLAELVQRWHRA
ncbi:hypothetical protein [Caldimonas taiwanensis]|jgi:hypothetical protein|uniref:hypothetical protein n=1 Tax=Caldimonas taiwanensis TaxID=307483 RepID=UPI000780A1FF|nr:hypothetical protein [Caldimonas taiwanensis]